MCDELTPEELARSAGSAALTRRNFALGGGAVVLAACSASDLSGATAGVVETSVTVATPDGKADAMFYHPAKGKHPGIVMWPDIAGIRDANKAPVLANFAEWRTPEGQARLKPMIAAINPAATMRDAAAFVAWLDRQPAVDRKRGIGSNGYCMGGPFAVRTALAAPGRVRAAASLHGGALVTPGEDSPHKLLGQTRAAFLFAIARNDDARSPGDKDALKAAAAAAGRKAEVEVYAADHGWTVPDSPVYNQAEAERAWSRMLALFATL